MHIHKHFVKIILNESALYVNFVIKLNLKTMDSVSPWEFIGPSFESQYDKDQDENWRFTDKSHNLIFVNY